MNNNPIGIFDSGIGGLTVLREIIKILPNENVIYLGDTARVPYGPRGKGIVRKFSKELVEYLLKSKVKALVVACNTISSVAIDLVQQISPVPVVDVISPGVEKALTITKTKTIGIIGTLTTVRSESYEMKIKELNGEIKVFSKACPLFVSIAEEGLVNNKIARVTADYYLSDFKNTNMDTLILGCTHFPLLFKVIQETVGTDVKLIDSAVPTALRLKTTLEKENLMNSSKGSASQILLTDVTDSLLEITSLFLGKRLNLQEVIV